ncbi:hypothetical protein BC938DRAFT_482290 [Jimgerdemannia flammicorona]|uniref:Uncharacterized protein n=1 Tax=Jimgerdemannia flammicorona TaxID=994334 RepID=A0A433QE93_9FUNG|nr:hypothetical protein BC938DRAFT_482290 [Jimgerdemannia flammicorona]
MLDGRDVKERRYLCNAVQVVLKIGALSFLSPVPVVMCSRYHGAPTNRVSSGDPERDRQYRRHRFCTL